MAVRQRWETGGRGWGLDYGRKACSEWGEGPEWDLARIVFQRVQHHDGRRSPGRLIGEFFPSLCKCMVAICTVILLGEILVFKEFTFELVINSLSRELNKTSVSVI